MATFGAKRSLQTKQTALGSKLGQGNSQELPS